MVQMNFDAGAVEPTVPFEPVPAGDYLVVITETTQVANKAGTGWFLKAKFEVIEGQYQGRVLWARLNLANPSDVAVAIARAELSAICRAVGVMKPADSQELHNLPLVVKVACKKRKDGNEIDNEIKGYKQRDAATPAAATAPPAVAPWSRPTPTASSTGPAPTPPAPSHTPTGTAAQPWRGRQEG